LFDVHSSTSSRQKPRRTVPMVSTDRVARVRVSSSLLLAVYPIQGQYRKEVAMRSNARRPISSISSISKDGKEW
jgi:hypothetical protein